MKIGIISDIHANLPALDAVLDRLKGCDEILCCGDTTIIGPHPEEVLQRLMKTPRLTCICGNHDRYLTGSLPMGDDMGEGEKALHAWTWAQLSEQSKAYLRSLPVRADLMRDGLAIAMIHYVMDDGGNYLPIVPRPDFRETADIVLYGHDHRPNIWRNGDQLCIDPGATGTSTAARAGILTIEGGQPDFEPLTVPYDAAQTIAAIREKAYPDHEFILRAFFGTDK